MSLLGADRSPGGQPLAKKRRASELVDDLKDSMLDTMSIGATIADGQSLTASEVRPLLKTIEKISKSIQAMWAEIKGMKQESAAFSPTPSIPAPDREALKAVTMKTARTEAADDLHKFDNAVKVVELCIKPKDTKGGPSTPEMKDAIATVDAGLTALLGNTRFEVLNCKNENDTVKTTFLIHFSNSETKKEFINIWIKSKSSIRTCKHFSTDAYNSIKELRELVKKSKTPDDVPLENYHIRILPAQNNTTANVNIAIRPSAADKWSGIGYVSLPLLSSAKSSYKNLPRDLFLMEVDKLKIKINEGHVTSKPEVFKRLTPVINPPVSENTEPMES